MPRCVVTPAPPCMVTKLLSVPFAGPLVVRSFAGEDVVFLIELNTMQTGVWQPAQARAPTVFELLMPMLQEKYSVPPNRSERPDSWTAIAILMRAVFGPASPSWYAPRPDVA